MERSERSDTNRTKKESDKNEEYIPVDEMYPQPDIQEVPYEQK
jgi:hypothetical protein